MTHKDILEYKIKLRDWWYSVHDDGFDISENKRYSLESIFLEALKAAEARGGEEERERIKKEIMQQTMLNDGTDTFVKLGEALWVCDSREDREAFLQTITPTISSDKTEV